MINPEIKTTHTFQQLREECEAILKKIDVTDDQGIYAQLYTRHISSLLDIITNPRINPEIKPDPVNPAHYKGDTVMVFIEEFNLGFCEGNAVKYIARHQSKGTPLEDLRKARWYLDRTISNLETEKNG